MACSSCGQAGRCCDCVIQQGSGVTVTGHGTRADPFIISAGGTGGTPFACSDLNSCSIDELVDVGIGGASDGMVLTFQGGVWQPATPSGSGGPGLTCEQIQDCVGAGFTGGLLYDDAANQFKAKLSTDAGNVLALGTDGGLRVLDADSGGGTCPDDTEFLDIVTLCTIGGDPIGVVVQRDCTAGTYTEIGWIDYATGTFTTGAPPAGADVCGGDAPIGATVEVERISPQSVGAPATENALAWDTQVVDTGGTPGIWDPSAPTRITFPIEGFWHVSCSIELSASIVAGAFAQGDLNLRVNATLTKTWYAQHFLAQADLSGNLDVAVTTGGLVHVAAPGDYMEAFLTGVSILMSTSNARGQNRLVARYVGS